MFSSPSGGGKTTIIRALESRIDGVGYSVSHTTRPPRGEEVDGVDYHFVDRALMEQMIKAGDFVEWATVYEDYYGTSHGELEDQTRRGVDVLLDLDVQGAGNIKEHYENSVLVFVLPPSLDVLAQRLRARATDDEREVRVRLREASDQMSNCLWYDYILVNDDLETAIDEARAIVVAERCRASRRAQKARELFGI